MMVTLTSSFTVHFMYLYVKVLRSCKLTVAGRKRRLSCVRRCLKNVSTLEDYRLMKLEPSRANPLATGKDHTLLWFVGGGLLIKLWCWCPFLRTTKVVASWERRSPGPYVVSFNGCRSASPEMVLNAYPEVRNILQVIFSLPGQCQGADRADGLIILWMVQKSCTS